MTSIKQTESEMIWLKYFNFCISQQALEQPREIKNGLIVLKFDTLIYRLDEYQ